MSSSEGFVGPVLRDVSPRIAKTSNASIDTRPKTAILPCDHVPRTALAARVGDVSRPGRSGPGRPGRLAGPDGIQDLHLRVTGLSDTVGQIVIQAPGGFEWATAPDPTGAALAEYFPSTSPGAGDLYLNPQIKSDLPSPGGTLPLGGSTGSLISLGNGVVLTVTINYQSGPARPPSTSRLRLGLADVTHARHSGPW